MIYIYNFFYKGKYIYRVYIEYIESVYKVYKRGDNSVKRGYNVAILKVP